MSAYLKRTTQFATGLDHPECIAVHIDGSVWAGGEAGQVYRISSDGSEVKEVANTGGFILGIAFDRGCNWLAICDSGHKCVWKLDLSTNQLSIFSSGGASHSFRIPNYPVFDSNGNLYVSESGAFGKVEGKVLKFTPDGQGQIWHNGPFSFANGMALGMNETHLYVVSSWLPGVERISINKDGTAGERDVYCTLPQTVPDGIAFDTEGNLYVSCYTPNAIYKISPDRTSILLVDDWEALTHCQTQPISLSEAKTWINYLLQTLGDGILTK